MWRPDEVVSNHKGRAIGLWVVMIVAVVAYASYLVYEAVERSKNPATSFVLSNEPYKYPDVYVCLYKYYGCDTLGQEEACLYSVYETEGGMPSAVLNPDKANPQTLDVSVFGDDEVNELGKGWCIVFHVSDVDVSDGDIEDNVILNMRWYPGGVANNSTTCMQEEGEWKDHSESVSVFLRDTDTEILSAAIQASYTCMKNTSSSHIFNYVTIGLTEVNKLDSSESTSTYKAISVTSVVRKDERNADITGIEAPYAWLSMELAQATDSLETISEIDPLEIAEIFGNVGGFWDLLLILWPLFFIATVQQNPHLKVRNCRKSVLKGKDRAKNLTSVSISLPTFAREHPRPRRERAPVTLEEEDVRPAWDSATVNVEPTGSNIANDEV